MRGSLAVKSSHGRLLATLGMGFFGYVFSEARGRALPYWAAALISFGAFLAKKYSWPSRTVLLDLLLVWVASSSGVAASGFGRLRDVSNGEVLLAAGFLGVTSGSVAILSGLTVRMVSNVYSDGSARKRSK